VLINLIIVSYLKIDLNFNFKMLIFKNNIYLVNIKFKEINLIIIYHNQSDKLPIDSKVFIC